LTGRRGRERECERERVAEAERLTRASESRAADERVPEATMAEITQPCPRREAPFVNVGGFE